MENLHGQRIRFLSQSCDTIRLKQGVFLLHIVILVTVPKILFFSLSFLPLPFFSEIRGGGACYTVLGTAELKIHKPFPLQS